jgi:hypothetical protein
MRKIHCPLFLNTSIQLYQLELIIKWHHSIYFLICFINISSLEDYKNSWNFNLLFSTSCAEVLVHLLSVLPDWKFAKKPGISPKRPLYRPDQTGLKTTTLAALFVVLNSRWKIGSKLVKLIFFTLHLNQISLFINYHIS